MTSRAIEVAGRPVAWEAVERAADIVPPHAHALTVDELAVLRCRFVEGLTLSETGLKVPGRYGPRSRERVRQLEAFALRKLQHPARRPVLFEEHQG